ncbi:MAG TPA: class I SAM-dependent methyltransferase [Candidatus Saccharimonadales bacterium]|nr:class I SAM-dependent methyltransferase [Candidatus Saccharimonadales bacterium]
MTFEDAKQRFSNRAEDYARYRPGYPREVLRLLSTWCHLLPHHVIADVGSGTGLLSQVFLENGNRVFGVEPNAEMRAAGEEYLKRYPQFTSVQGSAEATTLPDDSVDFVAAAQAFHWFEMEPTRQEFRRILKPGGRVIIVWNERLLKDTPFLREYEALLRKFATDYARVYESYPRNEDMLRFFSKNEFTSHALTNYQEFDFPGLSGRLRSSSYAPTPADRQFEPMMKELKQIFDAHQVHGRVRMEYRTRVYTGKLEALE